MNPPSLRSRIRNGTLAMLALVLLLGVFILPRLYELGGAIRETLYRNYVSIDAAQHMHADLRRLQLAELEGNAAAELSRARADFMHYLAIEGHDFTEVGEPVLARDIGSRAAKLFDEIAKGPAGSRHDAEFAALHERLAELIAMNKAAMFRADSRSIRMGRELAYEFAGGLVLVLLCGAAISWGLAWSLSKPLIELGERLRGISQRKSQVRLGPQRLAELEAVAREFNLMAERLEHYDRINIERVMYEKSKTEAIIEGLEDGVVLIDPDGIVVHINEIASVILGLQRADALGSPFDDLSSNDPHYLRVRDALRSLGKAAEGERRVEIELHVRGRAHSYVLKPVPLRQSAAGALLGTLLILQDVTFLRDQDRARSNLVATLSHELRTPLTSLALSAELLQREEDAPPSKRHELLQAILDECARINQLSANLLNLARGEIPAIAVRSVPVDLARIAADVAHRFEIQAGEKNVALRIRIEPMAPVSGDQVKLSWVVSNLIGNAMRYTPAGGTIEVVARPAGRGVRLEVADTGPGISPDVRNYIFERFAQYSTDAAERGSAGLGLAIVKDIVEAHGGRISVESNDGQGTRFIVELPAAAAA
jgi:two-component system, NtrC family, sensor histidine kinase KinB